MTGLAWLQGEIKEGDRIGYASSGWEQPKSAPVDRVTFRFIWVYGLKFSRQTGYLVGSKRSTQDARLKQLPTTVSGNKS